MCLFPQLVEMPDWATAIAFTEKYNLREFTSLQPERCRVVNVESVVFIDSPELAVARAGQIELPTCPVCLGVTLCWIDQPCA